MTLQEILQALQNNKIVHWSSDLYAVSGSGYDAQKCNVVFLPTNNMIGLTWLDGVTLNGEEKDFYIKGNKAFTG